MKKIITLEEAVKSHPSKEAIRVIQRALNTDYLTGLLNKRGFDERLERAMSRTQRYDMMFSCAFVDMHGLKLYNKISHQVGNNAIISMAQLLQENTREEDTVARIGGDEFSLLITGLETSMYQNYLRKMKMKIYEHKRIISDIPFLAYWGIKEYTGQSTEQLLKEASEEQNIEKERIKKILKSIKE